LIARDAIKILFYSRKKNNIPNQSGISRKGANMNRSLLLFLSFLFMQCTSPQSISEGEHYFDSANLDKLSLDNIPSFWKGCSLNVFPNCFNVYCVSDGHIDQRFYSSGVAWLGVVVFKNQSFAFDAAEFKTKSSSAVFKRGDSTTGKTWWFYESGPESGIICLKYNTFIEVNQYVKPQTSVIDSLWSAISEVENRMNRFAGNPPSVEGKYFNTKNLKDLDLHNIAAFWQGDSISSYNSSFVVSRIGLRLRDIGYSNATGTGPAGKIISVNVFKNTDIALQAIRDWKTTRQAQTYYGNSKGPIKGLWWYEGNSITPSYTTIVAQKWNTVVEVSYYPQNNQLILTTVSDILRKIDELSK
jgi:hypothetical protein